MSHNIFAHYRRILKVRQASLAVHCFPKRVNFLVTVSQHSQFQLENVQKHHAEHKCIRQICNFETVCQ